MARKITEIYDSMAASKAAMSELNGLLVDPQDQSSTMDTSQKLLSELSTSSSVAVWRLWMWVTATAIWALENLFDLFKVDISALIASKDVGTLTWYKNVCLEYQHGDELVWDGRRFGYAAYDETKRIIKKAAPSEANGLVNLKVAKLSSGAIAPLSNDEKTAFSAYIKKRKFAGTFVSVTSVNADTLWIEADIVYDPTLLSADGEALATAGYFPVATAINDYVADLNNEFNGRLLISELMVQMKAAFGVVDVTDISVQVKDVNNTTYRAVTSSVLAYSGHYIIDTAHPLSGSLTYQADV